MVLIISVVPISLTYWGWRRRLRPVTQQPRVGCGVQVVEVATVWADSTPGTLGLTDRHIAHRTCQGDIACPVCRLHQYPIARRTIDLSLHRFYALASDILTNNKCTCYHQHRNAFRWRAIHVIKRRRISKLNDIFMVHPTDKNTYSAAWLLSVVYLSQTGNNPVSYQRRFRSDGAQFVMARYGLANNRPQTVTYCGLISYWQQIEPNNLIRFHHWQAECFV